MNYTFTAIIADAHYGIRRQVGGEGTYGLGKVGERLVIEFVFSAIREIEKRSGCKIQIVAPYAEGLDLKYPERGPRDLFHTLTVPCIADSFAWRKGSESEVKSAFLNLCNAFNAVALPVNDEAGMLNWCSANLAQDEGVIQILPGQVGLNVDLSLRMINKYLEGEGKSIIIKGHLAGLTPAIYNRRDWLTALERWKNENRLPLPVNITDLEPALNAFEAEGLNILYKNGWDTGTLLLLRLFPNLNNLPPSELLKILREMGDEVEYESCDGRIFKIVLGERLQYWPDKPARDFQGAWEGLLSELKLLQEQAGFRIEGKEVLEIGAGLGDYTSLFRRAGAKLAIGSDISLGFGDPHQRRFLSQWPRDYFWRPEIEVKDEIPLIRGEGLFFLKCTGEELPFADDQFDLVYLNQVLEHVSSPVRCLNEIKRVVKPGGLMLLRYNPFFNLKGGHGVCTTDIPWGHILMTPEELENYFADTESPERGRIARENLKSYFNPQRMSLSRFDRLLENLSPVKIIHYHHGINDHLSERIDSDLLDNCRKLYPEIGLRDLLVNEVSVIMRKL